MTTLLLMIRRMGVLYTYSMFSILATTLPAFVEKKVRATDKTKQMRVSKYLASRILVTVAAAGPLTLPQLAGLIGFVTNDNLFFYTVKALKQEKILKEYGSRGHTKYYCVNNFTENYIQLSEEELRNAVYLSHARFGALDQVGAEFVLGPPAPKEGQTEIMPE